MITPHPDSAQVRFPPPYALLITIVLSIVLSFVWPSPFLPSVVRWVVGAGLFVGGAYTIYWSIQLFKKHQTAIPPWSPTLVLVHEGPYRWTRNPIYLSGMAIALGVVCLLDNAASLLLLVPLFLFLHFYVIDKEEHYLKAKFGEPYEAYLRSTRRWL